MESNQDSGASIGSIEFGVMRDIDVERQFSGREITSPTLYQANTNIPLEHGPLCATMGPSRRGIVCETCGGSFKSDGDKTCPGHHGFMKLAWRVYIPTFVQVVLKTLNSICDKCHKLVLMPTEVTTARSIVDKRARFKYITEICEKRGGCPTCNSSTSEDELDNITRKKKKKGKIYRRKLYTLEGKYEICRKFNKDYQGQRIYLTTDEVYNTLDELVSADVVAFLGLSVHPKFFIPRVIPILPNVLRPSSLRGNLVSEHSLTLCIAELARINNNAKDMVKNSTRVESVLREYSAKLQNAYVAMFLGSTKTQFEANASAKRYRARGRISSNQGAARKGILDKFKSKEGKIRGEAMGKRVNWSGRSVITADCKIAIGEFGVPYSVAATLTFPEIVNQHNIKFLTECVARGWQTSIRELPGAMFHISKRTGQRRCLAYYAKQSVDVESVKCGDIVERTMMDGDMILVNRQPSLHKWSMMAHKVRLMPGCSFRLNPSVTSPYAADFDGDEMNIHFPQSYAAQAELRELMSVHFGIVSAQKSAPVIGVIQDALTGSYLLTEPGVLIDEATMMNCLSEIGITQLPEPAIWRRRCVVNTGRLSNTEIWNHGEKYWTGHQLFSCLLSSEMSYDGRSNKSNWEHSEGMLICDGTLMLGQMTKKTLGASAHHSIAHLVYLDQSPVAAAAFLSNVQYVVNRWLQTRGFSVGLRDMILSLRERENVEKELNEMDSKLREPGVGLFHRRLTTPAQKWESEMLIELDSARDKLAVRINGIVASSADNGLHAMVTAGSKGTLMNQMQIMGFIGQQTINGKRIHPKFGKRTLPHFQCGDVGSDGCGFVRNSFLSGLLPSEFFFHMAGSRVGIVDTACKTEKSGYLERREVKVLEDYVVDQIGSVRGTRGRVLQFIYGDDGFDAQFLEKCRVLLWQMTKQKFLDQFVFIPKDSVMQDDEDFSEYLRKCARSYCQLRLRDPEACIREYQNLASIWQWINSEWRPPQDADLKSGARIAMPVDIERLIFLASRRQDKTANKFGKDDVIVALDEDDVIVEVEELIAELLKTSESKTMTYIANLQAGLASKNIVCRNKLTRNQFDWLKFQIKERVLNAKISAGAPVGVDSGHSISEPSTQMTLRTFHHAGITQNHVVMGIPGLEAMLACTQNSKYFVVSCRVLPNTQPRVMFEQTKYVVVRDIIVSYELRYIPVYKRIKDTLVFNESELYKDELKTLELTMSEIPDKALSDWVLVCTTTSVDDTKTLCDDDGGVLGREFGDKLFCTKHEDQRVIYIRCVLDTPTENKFRWVLNEFIPAFLSVRISGIPHATDVYENGGELSVCGNNVRMLDILYTVACDELDCIETDTMSSSVIPDVLDTLGIEAAREAILRRAWKIFSFDSNPPSLRHMAMLADFMTHTGNLSSVSRHGVGMDIAGPLARASFENQTDVMTSSAQFGAVDDCKDVSSCILTGKNTICGTGNIDVLLDIEQLKTAQVVSNSEKEEDAMSPAFEHTPYLDLRSMSPQGFGIQTPSRAVPASTPMFTNSGMYSPTSPTVGSPGWSPSSSSSLSSPNVPDYSAASPRYMLSSPAPAYSPTSPRYQATSPVYMQSSPAVQLNSPAYSPTSPSFWEDDDES